MCLMAWRWSPDAPEQLVLLSNRDEFWDRQAQPLARWAETEMWAGRDVRAGGTWLGVHASGRLAGVTNFRSPLAPNDTALSRGSLVAEFLNGQGTALAFATELQTRYRDYNGFNLLLFDGQALVGLEGRAQGLRLLQFSPGDGSVSNADFNSSWPKQVWLSQQLGQLLEQGVTHHEPLLDLLRHEQVAPDAQLPRTGLSLDKERALSSPFVRLPGYGTRASTAITLRAGTWQMTERSFALGQATRTTTAEVQCFRC